MIRTYVGQNNDGGCHVDVGWRGAAVNLSDLAAMGAFPIGITVALGITDNKKNNSN